MPGKEREIMLDKCKPIYKFLFVDHDIAFFRVCMAALVPCAISVNFCRLWMVFLCFMLTLCTRAKYKHWGNCEKDGEGFEE